MTRVLQAISYSILATGLAGCLATLILMQIVSVDFHLLLRSSGTFVGWSFVALLIRGFFAERWLRPLQRLQRKIDTNLADPDDFYGDLVEAVQFPTRSLFLSAILWILVISVSFWQMSYMQVGLDGKVLRIVVVLMALGGWAWILELFLNRRMVMPVAEEYLVSFRDKWQPDDPFLSRAQFPLRAKWMLLSMFLVGLTTMLGMVYTIGNLERVSNTFTYDAAVRHVDAILPILESEILTDDDIPASGVFVSEEDFRKSKTVSRITNWVGAPFWVFDEFGQQVYQSSAHLDLDTIHKATRIRRPLGPQFEMVVTPLAGSTTDKILPYFLLFAVVVSVVGGVILIVAILVGRDLSQTLYRLRQVTSEFTEGRFHQVPLVTSDDDIGLVAENLADMRGTFSKLLTSMNNAAGIFEDSNEDLLVSTRRIGHVINEQVRNITGINNLAEDLSDLFVETKDQLMHLASRGTKSKGNSEASENLLLTMDVLANELIDNIEVISTEMDVLGNSLHQQRDQVHEWLDSNKGVEKNVAAVSERLVATNELLNRVHSHDKNIKAEGEQQKQIYKGIESHLGTVRSHTSSVLQATSSVQSKVTDIKDALAWVNEIGDDTRLLSMNASILSAQAEKEGRSFSVIARNIESLADVADNSVQFLQKNIKKMVGLANDLTEDIDELDDDLAHFAMMLNETGQHDEQMLTYSARYDGLASELSQQIGFMQDRFGLVQQAIKANQDVLGNADLLLETQVFRFEDVKTQLRTVTARISEIKGHSQYQAGRSDTIREHVESIINTANETIDMISQFVDESKDLVEFGSYIEKNIRQQHKVVEGLNDDIGAFDENTRQFSSKLGRFSGDARS